MAPRKQPKRGGRTTPPSDESRRDRFIRIATPRIERALNSIRLLGNLASANYEWGPEDVAKIRQSVTGVLDTTLARFEKQRPTVPKVTFEKELAE